MQYGAPGLPVAVKIGVWAVAAVLLGVLAWAVVRSKAPAPSMTPDEVTPAPALVAKSASAVRKGSQSKNRKK